MRTEYVRQTELLAAARREVWEAFGLIAKVEARTRLSDSDRDRVRGLGERIGALLEAITR